MKLVFVSFWILFIIFSCPLLALDKAKANAIFKEANKAYENGDFDKAIKQYHQLVNEGLVSAEVYHNLGLSYSFNESLADAILYLEKGLRLKPNNQQLKQNLRLLNENVNSEISTLPEFFLKSWYNTVVKSLSVWSWIILHLIFLFAFSFFLYQYLIKNNTYGFHRSYIHGLLITLISLSFIFLAMSYSRDHYIHRDDFAIIMYGDAQLLAGAESNSKLIQELPRGLKVQISDQINDYLRIKLPDGNVGWMKKDRLKRI